MSDSKLAVLFFAIGLVLTLFSCVLGPVGIQNWSIACAAVACFLALGGIYLAFGGWDEAETTEQKIPEEPEKSANEKPEETKYKG